MLTFCLSLEDRSPTGSCRERKFCVLDLPILSGIFVLWSWEGVGKIWIFVQILQVQQLSFFSRLNTCFFIYHMAISRHLSFFFPPVIFTRFIEGGDWARSENPLLLLFCFFRVPTERRCHPLSHPDKHAWCGSHWFCSLSISGLDLSQYVAGLIS